MGSVGFSSYLNRTKKTLTLNPLQSICCEEKIATAQCEQPLRLVYTKHQLFSCSIIIYTCIISNQSEL